MTITESRVVRGTLTFGGSGGGVPTTGTAFACQATNVHVTPTYDDDGDDAETLCGDKIRAGKKETWVLGGSSIQDFDDPEGFLSYCYTNAMTTVAFEWVPNITGAPTWAGDVIILAVEEGGDVNARLTTDWEFDLVDRPTRTPFAGTQAEENQPEQTAA